LSSPRWRTCREWRCSLIFWDLGFVGALLGGARGLGGECSGDAELNGDSGGAFVGLLRLLRGVCVVGFVGLLLSGDE